MSGSGTRRNYKWKALLEKQKVIKKSDKKEDSVTKIP
jgi:hypothetical protein